MSAGLGLSFIIRVAGVLQHSYEAHRDALSRIKVGLYQGKVWTLPGGLIEEIARDQSIGRFRPVDFTSANTNTRI